MKLLKGLVLILFSCSALGLGVEKNDAAFEPRLNAFVEKAMKLYDVPGVAVGIVKDGKIIFKKGYGSANLDTGEKVNTKTLFKVASVSKSFTATAVMQLVERGLVRLDDPVAKHVPFFTLEDERHRSITVHMLLNHSSGIPSMYKAEFGSENPEFDEGALRRRIETLKNRDMEFDPGEKYSYSNHGYALLAALIENVSGMPFERYMEENVLKPAGMERSGFFFPGIDKTNLAAPHVLGEGFRYAVGPHFPVNRWSAGCGGLVSNIDDMCQWLLVCLNKGVVDGNRILGEESYRTMWKVSAKTSARMGLGWFLDDWLGARLVSHPGGGMGFSAECCLLPKHNLAVVVLCNARKSPVWPVASTAFRLMLGKKTREISPPLNIQMLHQMRDRGVDAAIGFYREKRKELPPEDFELNQLLILGHRLLVGSHPDRLEIARKILELNLEFYPEEAYAHDILAEAYLKLALKNYQRAIDLDPTNWGAREIVNKIK